MYVGIVIGRYKQLKIILIHGGDSFVRCLYRPEHRRLKRSVRKDVKLATYGRYLRGRHDVIE